METITKLPENLGFDNYRIEFSTGKNYPIAAKCIKISNKARFGYKLVFNYGFKSFEKCVEFVAKWLRDYEALKERRANDKAVKAQFNKDLKACDHYSVGDIVVNTWGWEQSNVDFYQVVKVGNKTIEVEQLCSEIVEGSMISHNMACDVVPVKDSFLQNGKKYRLLLKAQYNGAVFLSNPERYYYFHKWDGRPEYRSWYA